MSPRTRRLRASAALLAAAALAGCVSIPTSGPIGEGSPAPVELEALIPLPLGPLENADEEEIVAGFLRAAQAGVFQDYSTARQFLAPGANWDPRAVTMVASEDPTVVRTAEGSVEVEVSVAATVDATGAYKGQAPAAEPVEMPFELVRLAGQWRIASLPDGVVFRESAFTNAYTPVPVYFAAPEPEGAPVLGVPDVRWLPTTNRSLLLLRVVQALFGGPSPWLRDAVVTAVPNLAEAVEDVTGPDAAGVVTVALSSDVNTVELPEGARELLQAQLEATLMSSNLRGIVVAGVTVTADGVPWEPARGRAEPLVLEVVPPGGPFVLAGDAVAEARGREAPEPVPGLPSLAGLAAHHPAMSVDGEVWVVLDGPQRLVLLPVEGAEPQTLYTGTGVLLSPSVDRHDWIWTGERSSAGVLVAVSPQGDRVDVPAPWLAGREITSMRVSRDGTRIAIASVGPDLATTVEVASIIRNGTQPQLLSGEQPHQVGAVLTQVVELAWLDSTTLVVLGATGGSEQPGVYEVPIGGPGRLLQGATEGARGIAAGRADETVYVVDDDGVLRQLRNSSWLQVAVDVRDPVFPG